MLLDQLDAGVKGTVREQKYFRILLSTPFQLPAIYERASGNPFVFKQASRPVMRPWKFNLKMLPVRGFAAGGTRRPSSGCLPGWRGEHRGRPCAGLLHFHRWVIAKLIVGHGSFELFRLLIPVIDYY